MSLKIFCVLVFLISEQSFAVGVFRDGYNAETAGRAGVSVVGVTTPIGAMSKNPANLSRLSKLGIEVNLSIASFEANFTDPDGSSHRSSVSKGALPAFAFAWKPEEQTRLTLGFSIVPDIALETKYRFADPEGGLANVSYGERAHNTFFVAINASLSAAYQFNDQLSLGASAGLVYNRNELNAPYIFQDQAPGILPGFKTLLDLEVEGIGYTSQLGLLYKPTDSFEIGYSYHPKSKTRSRGRTTGNAELQLNQLGVTNFNPNINYTTKIDTWIPSVSTVGIKWDANENVSLMLQGEWVGYASTWNTLNIELSDGINSDLNNLLGANGFIERTPLEWEDQFILSVATSFALNNRLRANLGVLTTDNPIRNETTTPLTGAISEKVFSAGISGMRVQGMDFGISYQYVADSNVNIEQSALLGGEYSNTRFSLGGHWLNLSLHW